MFEKLDSLMFENVGKKLKTIVRYYVYAMFGLLIVGGVAMELYSLWQLLKGNGYAFFAMLVTPLAVLFAGFFVWLSVVALYGFAEVVDTAILHRKGENTPDIPEDLFIPESEDEDEAETVAEADDVWICPSCEGEVTYSEETKTWHCAHCHRMYQVVGKGWTQHLKEV